MARHAPPTRPARRRTPTVPRGRGLGPGHRPTALRQQLAAWAAIIAVPTAITGWYGQNVPYPGFDQPWGFVSSTALIVVLAGIIYLTLRRKGWL